MVGPQIPFRLRIKADYQIADDKKRIRASIIFAHLQREQYEVLSGKRWV